jgi:hypothetical protein
MMRENARGAVIALAITLIFVGTAYALPGQKVLLPRKAIVPVKPDLAVAALRTDKDCFVEIEIANTGLLAVDATLSLRLNIAGRTAFDEKIRFALASGGTLVVSTKGKGIRLQGDADVEAVLDADNGLPESDEANNRLSRALSCRFSPVTPDIALADLQPDPGSPQTLRLVSFRMLLANAGPETLPALGLSIPWRWRRKDGPWNPVGTTFTMGCKSLAPGESTWLAAKDQGIIPQDPGEYEFEVGDINVGSGLSAKETNLANNRRSVIFEVRPNEARPELAVTGLTVEPALPSPDSQIVVRAAIANQGSGPAPNFKTRLRILQDGRTVHEYSSNLQGFGPGATYEFQTVTDRLPAGRYLAEATTDADAAVAEGSESNNSLSRPFEVLAQGGTSLRPPDISVEDVAPDPEAPKAGASVGFRVHLSNRGPDPLPDTTVSITWVARMQGQPWPEIGYSFGAALKALGAGESAWVVAKGQAFGTDRAGTYEVRISNVVLTGAMTGRERELSNNGKIVPITVREP